MGAARAARLEHCGSACSLRRSAPGAVEGRSWTPRPAPPAIANVDAFQQCSSIRSAGEADEAEEGVVGGRGETEGRCDI